MDFDFDQIQELIQRPQESLAVELKAWLDPSTAKDQAKIVKGALALRNYGGGYLLIGFDDITSEPLFSSAPNDVKTRFHIDIIQSLISKYASDLFEVSVEFPEYQEQEFPVIIVPSGIKTPVVTKSDLPNPSQPSKFLIKADTVYVRSLHSNNKPSTTQAKGQDWSSLIERCFDNREADIARFIRRHLKDLKTGIDEITQEPPDRLAEFVLQSEQRYKSVVQERSLDISEYGEWEVAFIIDGQVSDYEATHKFLDLLHYSNPQYTGWPVWLDTRRFAKEDRPYVVDGMWEALCNRSISSFPRIDFMRLDPKGRFFLQRPLEDDLSYNDRVKPLTQLDFLLPITRTAEAIAVGIKFAQAMGCPEDSTRLKFQFKWTRLKNRQLTNWASPNRFFFGGQTAYQDNVAPVVNVPLDSPASTIFQYVDEATKPLFRLFQGYELNIEVIEDITSKLLNRQSIT